MRKIVVDVQHVSKSFGSEQVLENVTLQMMRGKIHGIIGRNGSGKTVLMKCICGFLRPTAGKISVFGKNIGTDCDFAPKTGMLIEAPGFLPHETGMSNLLWLAKLGNGARCEDVAALMRLVGLDPAAKKRVSQYSLGMRQRLGIAQALLDAPELLILDEPSAALTDIEVEGLFAIMRKLVSEGKSIIFISHKMREVMHISDRITVLRLGEVVGTVNCADTDSKKLASMMIGRELVASQYEKKDCSDAEIAVELSHVDYHKESKHNGLNDMSLTVHRGEIVGIAGVDGNGQTQLAQLITGVISPDSGTLSLSGQRLAIFDPHGFIEDGVSHVPEDRNLQGLIGDMSIAENLVLKSSGTAAFSSGGGLLLKKKAIADYAEEMAEKYDIRCTSVEQDVRSLSGGNQQKVILARELESDPVLLVATHPARGLDIGAASFIHDQMIAARDRGVGILLISADFDEILEMSDRILVCFEGQIMGEYSGKNPPIEEISLAMTGK